MRKYWIIFALGIATALMPFLGFSGAFKTFFFVVFGLSIAVLMFLIIARERYTSTAPQVTRSTQKENISKTMVRESETEN